MMKIGQLAKITGCSIQTIRYYENESLLTPPKRSEGNYRIYSKSSLEQLEFIKHCRKLDISLNEIKQLLEIKQLPNNQCREVNDLVENQLKRADTRIEELKELRSSLLALQSKCRTENIVKDCGILQGLSKKQ